MWKPLRHSSRLLNNLQNYILFETTDQYHHWGCLHPNVCVYVYSWIHIHMYIYIYMCVCVCLLPLYSYDTLWYSHVTCLSPQSCPIKPSSSMGYPYILLVIPCYPSIFRSVISICCCFSIYRSPFFHPRPDLPLKPASRSSKFSMDSRSFRPSTSPHCTSVADFYRGKPVNR